jgi:hypothetical protein
MSLDASFVYIRTCNSKQGNEVLISKGNTLACPVSILRHYVSLSNLFLSSDFYIFRPIYRHKGIAKLICKHRKISYTATRENILKRLRSVEQNLNLGLHSLRSGGASAANMYVCRMPRTARKNTKKGQRI